MMHQQAGALWALYVVSLACASPDLAHTRFSCATDADCAPGQRCAAFPGGLACQSAGAIADDECPVQSCNGPDPAASHTAPSDVAPLPVTPSESVSSETPELDTPLADPGRAGEEKVEQAATPAIALLTADAGAAEVVPATPSVQFDFESGLDGWQADPNQRPAGALDIVEQSAVLAHHGTGALRMVFDGQYTPNPPFTFDPGPSYGVYEAGAPPAGVDVSLWMFATAPGTSVEVYTQSGAAYDWTVLATVPLRPNEWRQITVAMPLVEARLFGIRVHSPLDFAGVVYLDEIRW